jgi:hypothetical protein
MVYRPGDAARRCGRCRLNVYRQGDLRIGHYDRFDEERSVREPSESTHTALEHQQSAENLVTTGALDLQRVLEKLSAG